MILRALIITMSVLTFVGCHHKPNDTPFGSPPMPPVVAAPGMGGGATEVGPGGDNLSDDDGTAWFAEGPQRPVNFCIEVSASFGFPPEELPTLVEGAFRDWREYLEVKRVTLPKGVALSLTPSYRAQCSGNEDLTFYFGVNPEEVVRAKRNFVNPTAFPGRRSYVPSQTGGWGKGFIWVAAQGTVLPSKGFPDWSKKEALGATLRHEVAHTLGLGHIEGTVLAANISTYLRNRSSEELSGIDIDREVFHCVDCADAYQKIVPLQTIRQGNSWLGAWGQITIRNPLWDPTGPVTITVLKFPTGKSRALRHHIVFEDSATKGASGRLELATPSVHYSRAIAMPSFALKSLTELGLRSLLDVRYETLENFFQIEKRYDEVRPLEDALHDSTVLNLTYNGVSRIDGGSKSLQVFNTFDEFPLAEFTVADRIPFPSKALDQFMLLRDEENKLSLEFRRSF